MFGIGFPELIVICVVALIFIGPKKLPDLMRQGGKLFVQLRRTANDVKSSFEQVVHEAEEEMRRTETEALRQAILADHIKPKNLLEANDSKSLVPHQSQLSEHEEHHEISKSHEAHGPNHPEGTEPFSPHHSIGVSRNEDLHDQKIACTDGQVTTVPNKDHSSK